ncbi:MAG: hypothetical protein QNJ42_23485 [Crocosphaera sp.]|nr:hypothetical protein [Crocosphaera sp.]
MGKLDNPQQYFDLAWSNFVKFVDGVQWENEDVAQPIAMPGRTSVSKFLRFDWSPLAGDKFNLSTGQYELFLLLWSSQSEKPDIQHRFLLTITEDIRNVFQKTIDNEESFGIWIPIDDTRRSNRVITRVGFTREYE